MAVIAATAISSDKAILDGGGALLVPEELVKNFLDRLQSFLGTRPDLPKTDEHKFI